MHSSYMQRALSLAQLGEGNVSPNPMVGAVLVHEDRIIGEGYHRQAGFPHAEINCLDSVAEIDKSLIASSTLYVTLEPCSHFGKTPPCVDRIIQEGIQNVVVAVNDPYEKVAGRGIQKLKDAGVSIIEHILEDEAIVLNRRFFKFHTQKLPYVILKWAQTKDGFIASGKNRLFITGDEANARVHTWRSQEDAILVGARTAIQDDPLLNVRLTSGRSPKRFILSNRAEIPSDLRMMQDGNGVFILNAEREIRSGNIRFLQYDLEQGLIGILKKLYHMQIQSILVEGGAETLQGFLNAALFDEIRVITNTNLEVGEGLHAPKLPGGVKMISESVLGQDRVQYFMKS